MESWYHNNRWQCGGLQPRHYIVSALFVFAMLTCFIGSMDNQKLQDQDLKRRQQAVSPTNTHNIILDSTHHRYLKNQSDKKQSIFSDEHVLHSKAWSALQWLFIKKCPTFPKSLALPGRKGVAFTLREEGQPGSWVENLPKVTKLRPYWNYSWGPQRIAQQPNDIEFVPMLWGGNDRDQLKTALTTHILPQIKKGTVKRVLGFNEPDSEAQSNMEVSIALDRWKELESLGVPLVSPSCAQPANNWMMSFMKSANKNCKRIDWVGVHWYGTDFASLKSAMTKFHDLYDRPILVTEFALADWTAKKVSENKISKADTLEFMKEAVYWLETQSWIVGYAWFSFDVTHPAGTNSALFNDNGTLTTLGKFYASVRTNRPRGDRNIFSK